MGSIEGNNQFEYLENIFYANSDTETDVARHIIGPDIRVERKAEVAMERAHIKYNSIAIYAMQSASSRRSTSELPLKHIAQNNGGRVQASWEVLEEAETPFTKLSMMALAHYSVAIREKWQRHKMTHAVC